MPTRRTVLAGMAASAVVPGVMAAEPMLMTEVHAPYTGHHIMLCVRDLGFGYVRPEQVARIWYNGYAPLFGPDQMEAMVDYTLAHYAWFTREFASGYRNYSHERAQVAIAALRAADKFQQLPEHVPDWHKHVSIWTLPLGGDKHLSLMFRERDGLRGINNFNNNQGIVRFTA